MNKYRIWVKDIALQSMVVEAASEAQARRLADDMIEQSDMPIEQDGGMSQSLWEVESIDQLID